MKDEKAISRLKFSCKQFIKKRECRRVHLFLIHVFYNFCNLRKDLSHFRARCKKKNWMAILMQSSELTMLTQQRKDLRTKYVRHIPEIQINFSTPPPQRPPPSPRISGSHAAKYVVLSYPLLSVNICSE
jgi:hypothetical protein